MEPRLDNVQAQGDPPTHQTSRDQHTTDQHNGPSQKPPEAATTETTIALPPQTVPNIARPGAARTTEADQAHTNRTGRHETQPANANTRLHQYLQNRMATIQTTSQPGNRPPHSAAPHGDPQPKNQPESRPETPHPTQHNTDQTTTPPTQHGREEAKPTHDQKVAPRRTKPKQGFQALSWNIRHAGRTAMLAILEELTDTTWDALLLQEVSQNTQDGPPQVDPSTRSTPLAWSHLQREPQQPH